MRLQRSYFPIVLAFFAFWFSGCATAPVEQPPVVSAASLQFLCDQHQIQMEFDSVSQVVTLTQGNMKAMALIGSSVVVIGQEKVTLSGPVRRDNNVIVVPPDFRREVIDRFSGAAAVAPAVMKIKRIVVDAGHGGKDPGAEGRTGSQEKKINLDIAKRLQRILENKGFEVRMTRESDQFIPLERRSQIAAQSRADIFVSIHANSSPEPGVDGVEIYTLRELTYQEKKDPVRMDNHQALFKKLDMQKNNMTLEQIVGDMLYKYKQWQSPALAEAVAKRVSGEAKAEYRGNKTAYFSVLRNTLVPAVLVEVGFLTNAREERMLKTAAYRQALAEGIAQGVWDYANR